MIWTEATYTIEYDYINIHILLYIWTNRWTMIKLFHLSWECTIQNSSKCAAYAVTALRDEQITAVRLCRADTLINNGQQSIKRNILAQWKASNYLQMFMCAERWSQYSTNNRLTVGNVHRTLTWRKQKQTSALCVTNGERSTRNTSNPLWTCLLQQIRLEHFEIISSVSIST